MDGVSALDFSSILNVARQPTLNLGGLDGFGGMTNPFAGFGMQPNAGTLFGGSGFGGQNDMMQMMASIIQQNQALDKYLKLDTPQESLKDRAQKISDTQDTVETKDLAQKISKIKEGCDKKADKKDDAKKDENKK